MSSMAACRAVHDAAVEHAIVGRRNLQHDWPDILRIEERHEIDHVRVGRERLVPPVQQTGPKEDLVELALHLADHLLVHEVIVDHRHAPDDGFDRAAVDGAVGDLLGREVLCLRRCAQESDSESCECYPSHGISPFDQLTRSTAGGVHDPSVTAVFGQ